MMYLGFDTLHELPAETRAEIEAYLTRLPAGTTAARHIRTLLDTLDSYQEQFNAEAQTANEWLVLELPAQFAPFRRIEDLVIRFGMPPGPYA